MPTRPAIVLASAVLAASSLFVQAASANEKFMFTSVRHIPDWQVDAGVQAATRACDPDDRRAYETRQFKACMLRLGWRYSHVRRFAAPHRSAADAEQDKRNMDESFRAGQQRDEEMMRNTISSIDDQNATQQMFNLNANQ